MKTIHKFTLFFNVSLLGALVIHNLAHYEYIGFSSIVAGEGCRFEAPGAGKYVGKPEEESLGRVEDGCSLFQDPGERGPEGRPAEAKVSNELIKVQLKEASPLSGHSPKFVRANFHGMPRPGRCRRFVSAAYEVPVERQHGEAGLSRSPVALTTPSVVAQEELGVQSVWDDQSISRREADQMFSDPALRSEVLGHPQAADMMRSAMRSDPELGPKLKKISDSPVLARGILMTPIGRTSWGYQGMGLTAQEADRLIAIAQKIMLGKALAQ
jgi:hypothetical protein